MAVTKLVEIPHIVVASAALPAKNIAELIALAKKEPGKINFASVGLGSYPAPRHGALHEGRRHRDAHVPYKGGAGQAIPAMVAGEVQVAFFNMASLLPHIRSGRLKALAADPRSACPSFPTCRRSPSRATRHRHQRLAGHVRPAATPRPVVDKLYASVAAVLTSPSRKKASPSR